MPPCDQNTILFQPVASNSIINIPLQLKSTSSLLLSAKHWKVRVNQTEKSNVYGHELNEIGVYPSAAGVRPLWSSFCAVSCARLMEQDNPSREWPT